MSKPLPMDAALLLATLKHDPAMYQTALWANALKHLADRGKVKFPIPDVATLRPLFDGRDTDARITATEAELAPVLKQIVPGLAARLFPITSLEDFIDKCLMIIRTSHVLGLGAGTKM